MNQVGQVWEWELVKIPVQDEQDMEETVKLMCDRGEWKPVCTSQTPITLKRKDGQTIIQPPRRNYYIEHDESAALGDIAVSGWV
jgi:hypothetical protein